MTEKRNSDFLKNKRKDHTERKYCGCGHENQSVKSSALTRDFGSSRRLGLRRVGS